MMSGATRHPAVASVLLALSAATLSAQVPIAPTAVLPTGGDESAEIGQALLRLPLATALAAVLALRPPRRGSPSRNLAVIHTQIILAVVGALVMLVVGSSLARAFGIVGAAGLVRYRAKIEDPKDAGVMLSTLAIGLATGVGQWQLAIFGTAFVFLLLWIVESFGPIAEETLVVAVKAKDMPRLKDGIERLFRDQGASFDVRMISPDELQYEVRWPAERPSKRLSERLAKLDKTGAVEVEVETKKKK
jgi:uncharacterized membrane protein YhiD involved in acid resistance